MAKGRVSIVVEFSLLRVAPFGTGALLLLLLGLICRFAPAAAAAANFQQHFTCGSGASVANVVVVGGGGAEAVSGNTTNAAEAYR